MKLKKVIRKAALTSMSMFVAAALSFTGCSSSTGSSDNDNSGSGNQNQAGNDVYSGDVVTFTTTENSVNAEDTKIFVKYDRSAEGADELITLENVDLSVTYNGTAVSIDNAASRITFALDEYGSSFDTRLITDSKKMKEYKTKLNLNKKISAGDVVTVQLKSAKVSGAGKDTVDLSKIVIALIDTNASVDYYKELCPNAEEYKQLITKKNDSALNAANGGNENPAANVNQVQGTAVDLSGFNGWGTYTVSATATAVTLSHDSAVAKDSCCGMDLSMGENNTLLFKVKNNSATEKAYVKFSLKNDAWSTSNGYKSCLKSATVDNSVIADVSYGALTELNAGAEAQVILSYDTTLAACDKFVVSLNSESGTMPAAGNITIESCVMTKIETQTPANGGNGNQLQGTAVNLSGFDGWNTYTVSATATAVTISHDSAVAKDSCCGMDLSMGENNTLLFKVKNNSATEKAYVKFSLKNDAWSTSNGYKSCLKSATVDSSSIADVSYGALAELNAGAEAQVILTYDTTLAACDKFVVSLNSESGTMPAAGNITIESCVMKK